MRRFPVKRAAMAAFAALGLSACASPLSTPPPPVSVPPASAVALAGDETAVGERSDPTAVAPTPVEPATAADTATESAAAEVTAESAAPELTQPAAPSTAPASSPVAPAAVAPTTIDQQALDLIAAMKREVAVQATRQAADAANSAAGTLVEASRARVERAEAARPVLDATRVAALDVRDTVRAEVHHLKDRLADVVVESFQLSHTAGDASSRDLGGMLGDGGSFADYSAGSAYGEVALRTVQDQLSASRARLADAESALAAASDALADNEVELNESRSGLESAQSEATKVAADGEAAVQRASVTGDSAPVGLEGPTIMGPSVVSAADMAAFVQAKGNPHPSLDVTELARTFLDEGEAEGVRGDLAYIQAIIETGWFSFHNSMVDPQDHNYAGIGACDSCSDGFGFPTMQLGVRAQIQLLRAYAEPGLVSEDFASPAVRTRPEKLGVRGCCNTWMALSGVWATGPGYGQKILGLYNDLLAFTVSRSASAP